MPVPAPLAAIAERLRCPVCLQPLAPVRESLTCPHGHTYDVARQGYVTLPTSAGGPDFGDDGAMVAARVAVQEAGHFAPLTVLLADEARTAVGLDAPIVPDAGARAGPDSPVVLDVGAGTGHHLAGVLAALPQARGVALDASRHASRRAARAHPRIAAVRTDVWQHIPLGDATVDLALSVFAPRNGAELARVLRPGGALLVVTPTQEHLRELAALHNIRVDPLKPERLGRQLGQGLRPDGIRPTTWTMELTPREAEAVLRMGPAGMHLRPQLERRLASLPNPLRVTAAVELRTFRA